MALAAATIAAGCMIQGCADQLVLSREGGTASDAGSPDAAPARDGGPDGGARACPPACAMSGSDPCGLVPDCGCPCGETCRLRVGVVVCEATGVGAEGDACMGPTDCGPGLDCIAGGFRLPGICLPYCRDGTSCGEGACHRVVRDGVRLSDEVGTCSSDCDPVSGSGCASLFFCRLRSRNTIDLGLVLSTVCETPGPVGAGGLCHVGDCGSGLSCNGGAVFFGVCLSYCGTDSECADGPCLPFTAIETAVRRVLGLCPSGCLPTDATSCPAPLGCQHFIGPSLEGTTTEFALCRPSGTGTEGMACNDYMDCARGYTCALGACRRYCTANAECGAAPCLRVAPAMGACADGCDVTTGSGCTAPLTCGPLTAVGIEEPSVSTTVCQAP